MKQIIVINRCNANVFNIICPTQSGENMVVRFAHIEIAGVSAL